MTSIDTIKSKIYEAKTTMLNADTCYKNATDAVTLMKYKLANAEEELLNAENVLANAETCYKNATDDVALMKYKLANAEEELLKVIDTSADAQATLYDLNIELQTAEALASVPVTLARPVGTKYKWTHKDNPETYRVAIQTKRGVLQVKSVNDGVPELHETMCTCSRCWEFLHLAPGAKKPLKTAYFPDLTAWDNTLPYLMGKLVITSAPISDKALKALCMKPLEATTDALKLKELEERFPGGVFVLSTPKTQFEISYKRVANEFDQIYYAKINMSFFHFSDYCGNMKIQLLVEWRGLYIDLTHLF